MPVMAMPAAQNSGMMGIFADPHTFTAAMQMADALSKSTIIPRDYQGNPSNCLIAVEMSSRMNASPMMVMQHLFVVNGRPAWSSQWIVAMINQSRKYKTELQYEFGYAPEDGGLSCYAWAIDQQGHRVEGPKITMKMAEAEGWLNKNGSKWKTMPQVMIQYRAASFFGRKNCPDMIMGIYSREEVLEMDLDDPAPPVEPGAVTVEPAGLTAEDLKPITQDDRKAMFKKVVEHFGDDANEVLRTILSEFGTQSTDGMPRHIYNKAMQRIEELTGGGGNG
jgi:hypothetical protein